VTTPQPRLSSGATTPSAYQPSAEASDFGGARTEGALHPVFITEPLPQGVHLSARGARVLLAKLPPRVAEEAVAAEFAGLEGLETCDVLPEHECGQVRFLSRTVW